MLYFSGMLMFKCFKVLYYLLLQCHFVASFSYWVVVYSFVSRLISLLPYRKKKHNYFLLYHFLGWHIHSRIFPGRCSMG